MRYIRMEVALGWALTPRESVHHKNGIKTDNGLENLELWCRPQIPGQRVMDMIRWVVEKYPAEVRTILECSDAAKNVLNDNKHAIQKG